MTSETEPNLAKSIGIFLLTAATIAGTYTESKGLIPIVTIKHEQKNSYGINVGVFGTEQESNSTIYGANVGIFNFSRSEAKLNGLELGLFNEAVNTSNTPKKINGLQIGLYNGATAGNLAQIGLINKICLSDGSTRYSVIFNCAFEGSSK